VIKSNFVTKPTNKDFQKLEVNFVSLLDIISLGMLCSLHISFTKMLTIFIALQVDLTGIK
jgi:hypothetical protein